jgi:tRNA C32,U32 (ribose-2'-O)-methylase TrmJ
MNINVPIADEYPTLNLSKACEYKLVAKTSEE